MPKGFSDIKGNRHIIRMVIFEQTQKDAGKTVNAGGRLTGGGLPMSRVSGTEGVIGAISEGVSVYEIKGWGHKIRCVV